MAYSMTALGAVSAFPLASSITFSAFNFGTADPSRLIVVGMSMSGGGSAGVTQVTIGGVPATLRFGTIIGGTAVNGYSWWEALVPTGTSGNIVVGNGSTDLVGVIVLVGYSVIQGAFATAHGGQIIHSQPLVKPIPVPIGGSAAVLASAQYATTSASQTATWTGTTNSSGDQQSGYVGQIWGGSSQVTTSGAVSASISPDALDYGVMGYIAYYPATVAAQVISTWCPGSPGALNPGYSGATSYTYTNLLGSALAGSPSIPAGTTFVLFIGAGVEITAPPTIGGVTMTKATGSLNSGSGVQRSELWYADLASATTDTLVVYWGSYNIPDWGLECWFLTGAATGGPVVTASTLNQQGVNPISISLAIPANGLALAGFFSENNSGAYPVSSAVSWTNLAADGPISYSAGQNQAWATHSTATGSVSLSGSSTNGAEWSYLTNVSVGAWIPQAAIVPQILSVQTRIMM